MNLAESSAPLAERRFFRSASHSAQMRRYSRSTDTTALAGDVNSVSIIDSSEAVAKALSCCEARRRPPQTYVTQGPGPTLAGAAPKSQLVLFGLRPRTPPGAGWTADRPLLERLLQPLELLLKLSFEHLDLIGRRHAQRNGVEHGSPDRAQALVGRPLGKP